MREMQSAAGSASCLTIKRAEQREHPQVRQNLIAPGKVATWQQLTAGVFWQWPMGLDSFSQFTVATDTGQSKVMRECHGRSPDNC